MRFEHWWFAVPLRARSFFRRNRVEQELEEEFRFHLDQLIAQELAAGKSADEAKRVALRAMDGIERQKERCRDMRRVPYIETQIHDFRHAVRALVRKPLFAGVVIAILALGIGASTAVFSVVNAVLLQPLPYISADRLVRIEESTSKRGMNAMFSSDFMRLRERADLFDSAVAYIRDDVSVTGIPEPTQAIVNRTSSNLFSMLGAHARFGRTLVVEDDNPSAPNVAVLSHQFWERAFRSEPGIVGRVIHLSDEPYTVVGVMPADFEFEYSNMDLWVPLRLAAGFSIGWPEVIARIRAGITISQAQSALNIAAHQFAREDPKEKAELRIVVSPWKETPTREYELTLVFIFGAVGLVLMIACVNVASLLLSRAIQRKKEMAIRASLGAGLWQVIRQLLAEGFTLASAASVAGVGIAYYALEFLVRQLARLPIPLPHLQRIALDGRVFVFSIVLCVILACFISVAPIVMSSKLDLHSTLRSSSAGGSSRTSTHLFSVMIACESAFAFLLLAGSGLMVHSLVRLEAADHGFRPDHVLTIRVPVGSLKKPRPGGKYDTKPQQMAYYHELVERLRRVPGVKALAVVNNLPLSNVNTTLLKETPDGRQIGVAGRTISPEYFTAIGTRLIAGRFFTDADNADSPEVVIINERMAQEFFPGHYAVGEKLGGGPTIVGVVQNTPQQSYEKAPEAEEFLPYTQFIFGAFMSSMVVRTSGNPMAVADTLKRAIWTVDARQPIVRIETLQDIIDDAIWRPRFSAWLFSVLGGLALLLTSIGVYAVVAYTTAFRTREIGIRVAMGAAPQRVIVEVVRGAMVPLAAGLSVSVVAALLLSRFLASVLYEIRGTDPIAYLGAIGLLLAVGAVASARPAWRAANGDAMQALGAE